MPSMPRPRPAAGPEPAAASARGTGPGPDRALPAWGRPLAVVAHPDDESFGLGAVLGSFVDGGARPSLLCFTHGEASTLHGVPGDLRRVRELEVRRAGDLLGVEQVVLLDRPDGRLDREDPSALAAEVVRAVEASGADGLLAFDEDGVTGHPDHVAATAAALLAGERTGLGVLAWTLPVPVAEQLNREFSASFRGRPSREVHLLLEVTRDRQLEAVRAHPSQALPSSVLWRRLELTRGTEHLVWLRRPPVPAGAGDPTGPF